MQKMLLDGYCVFDVASAVLNCFGVCTYASLEELQGDRIEDQSYNNNIARACANGKECYIWLIHNFIEDIHELSAVHIHSHGNGF